LCVNIPYEQTAHAAMMAKRSSMFTATRELRNRWAQAADPPLASLREQLSPAQWMEIGPAIHVDHQRAKDYRRQRAEPGVKT
jgi:predicted Zn-dependent protease